MTNGKVMKVFDVVTAEFRPKRTDNLIPGATDWIGRVADWEALWIIDCGEFYGEWAMRPLVPNTTLLSDLPPFAWVPLCNLIIVGEK